MLEDPTSRVSAEVHMKTPWATVVGIALVVFAFLLAIATSIGGSYLLANHAIAQERQNEVRLAAREATANLRSAIPTCRALIRMDDAKNGATNASSSPNSYGHRLAEAITNVVNDTHCRPLIYAVDHGVPLSVIVKEVAAHGRISSH